MSILTFFITLLLKKLISILVFCLFDEIEIPFCRMRLKECTYFSIFFALQFVSSLAHTRSYWEEEVYVMKNDYETPWWVIWTIFSCQKRIYRFIVLTLHMIDTFIVLQIINVLSKFDKQLDRVGLIFYI